MQNHLSSEVRHIASKIFLTNHHRRIPRVALLSSYLLTTMRQRRSLPESLPTTAIDVEKEKASPASGFGNLSAVTVVTAAGMGLLFGTAFEKGRVFEPWSIRGTLTLDKFLMMKMFLSAVATSQLAFSVLSIFTPKAFKIARDDFASCCEGKGQVATAVGGAILGAGMAVAGACPGMVLAQVGAGTQYAVAVLLGGFAGSFLFNQVAPYVRKYLYPLMRSKANGTGTLDSTINIPYGALSFGVALLMGGAVYGLEVMFPWRAELASLNPSAAAALEAQGDFPSFSFSLSYLKNLYEAVSWPPALAGVLIGILQVPAVLFLSDTLGSATSYETLVNSVSKYLGGFVRVGRSYNWWQVVYVIASIVGAFVSSSVAGASIAGLGAHAVSIKPIESTPVAFAGGALLVFGSRLAAGCTSGHGLSGMGLLFNNSVTAVVAMFAGGIGTAMALRAGGYF